jgi:protein-L-isoaspartate(D-aspartate) O-methyltransferase
VIVTAAPDLIPTADPATESRRQAGNSGRPAYAQTLILVEKPSNGGVTTKEILPVRFSQLESGEAA